MAQKSKNSKFELEKKLDHQVEFHGESNVDSLDALKRCLDSKMAHRGIIKAIKIWPRRKVRSPIYGKISREIEGDSLEALKLCWKIMSSLAHSAWGALRIVTS